MCSPLPITVTGSLLRTVAARKDPLTQTAALFGVIGAQLLRRDEVRARPESVSGNIAGTATGGLSLFELDGHFPVFFNPEAIAQWTGFMGSLANDPVPTIPARP